MLRGSCGRSTLGAGEEASASRGGGEASILVETRVSTFEELAETSSVFRWAGLVLSLISMEGGAVRVGWGEMTSGTGVWTIGSWMGGSCVSGGAERSTARDMYSSSVNLA